MPNRVRTKESGNSTRQRVGWSDEETSVCDLNLDADIPFYHHAPRDRQRRHPTNEGPYLLKRHSASRRGGTGEESGKVSAP